MRIDQLEHILRAAGGITDEREFVVIGSQAILGSVALPPPELTRSAEVDLYPRHAPEKADLIDGALGDGSLFQTTFGYWAHGVGPETAVLAPGWERRLVRLNSRNTGGAVGWCLEPNDLVLAKAARASTKDLDYLAIALRNELVELPVLRERLAQLNVASPVRNLIAARLA